MIPYRGYPGFRKAYKKARWKKRMTRFMNWCEHVGL